MAFELQTRTKEEMAKELPLVIDFGLMVHMVTPIIEELATEYAGRVQIGKMNGMRITILCKYGVRNIPTILFIKNGEVIERKVGAQIRHH